MSLLGTYFVLKADGATIAESTDVTVKYTANALETSSKDTGLYSSFMAGTVKIGVAGQFLVASTGANFDRLFEFLSDGTSLSVDLFWNGERILQGDGIMKQISMEGGDAGTLVTGAFAMRVYSATVSSTGQTLLTEAGVEITTETDVEITTE